MDVFEFGDPGADVVLVQPVNDLGLSRIEEEIKAIRERTDVPFRFIAAQVADWYRDLSPWEAPSVFGNEVFGSGAAGTLDGILQLCGDIGRTYCIGGYSLAGLFALWAAFQTDRFAGVAAASPSVWFPGFADYMRAHELKCGAVYLSLGTREEKTNNRVMAAVGERIREAYELLLDRGVTCTLEWNPGNHFRDAELRTAKAFAWTIGTIQGQRAII